MQNFKEFNAELDEAIDKEHPIVKEYNALKKNHDIKSLRGLIKGQHKIVDTSEYKTKDHAISAYLRSKHGDTKVDKAFGFKESVICSDCDHDPCICDDSHGFVSEAAQGHTIEAHGIRGMKGTPWRKTFKSHEHLSDWADKNDSIEVHATRELDGVKKKTNEEAELDEVFADQGSGSTAKDNAEYMKRRKAAGATKHKVSVTVSEKDHPMVSKRLEKQQKRVIVSADSKEEAVVRAKKFYSKQGYHVHDAEHVSTVNEEVELQEDDSHSVHINGRHWKTFDTKSHAENVAKKIKGATVHKYDAQRLQQNYAAKLSARNAARGKDWDESVELDEANFAGAMKSAIAAHERGDHKKAKYHLDNAKTARYAMKSTEIAKNKDLLDKYTKLRDMHKNVELDEARMSAAQRLSNAWDKQRAKSDASLRRTPSSIPKKEEPKKEVAEALAGNLTCMSCGEVPCQCDKLTSMVETGKSSKTTFKEFVKEQFPSDKFKKYTRPVVKTIPKMERDTNPSGRTTDHVEWKVTTHTGEVHRHKSKKEAQAHFDSLPK
jgi:hypothetical protein